jgi:hypothetical protein
LGLFFFFFFFFGAVLIMAIARASGSIPTLHLLHVVVVTVPSDRGQLFLV